MIKPRQKTQTIKENIPVKITPISKTVITENNQTLPGIDVT